MQSVSTSSLNTSSTYAALKWTADEVIWGSSLYVSGLYALIIHPIQTLKNLGKAIWHPLDTSESVAQQLIEHPLGSAINVALSYGTGMALSYALESQAVNFTVQTGLEASTMEPSIAASTTSSSLALPEIAAAAIETTAATVMLLAEVATSKSMRLLRQAAKALSHFEIEG